MTEGQKIPVLVIDDDDFMLDLIRGALDKLEEPCNCQFFDNEEDFENAITSETHIAIIDHLLGGAHVGLEVIERFELKRKTKIPSCIIIVSGQTREEVMIRYINEKKVHAYIRKPDQKKTVAEFQSEVVKYTRTAIDQTKDWIELFKSLQNFK